MTEGVEEPKSSTFAHACDVLRVGLPDIEQGDFISDIAAVLVIQTERGTELYLCVSEGFDWLRLKGVASEMNMLVENHLDMQYEAKTDEEDDGDGSLA